MLMNFAQSFGTYGEAAGSHLFGGNVLAPRTETTGDSSYDEAIQGLGVSGLRYPGGALTEEYFDLRNPDSPTATNCDTGESTDFIPISEFMSYAADNGHPASIVLPTRHYLSDDVDQNGDRMANVDEEGLRDFIHDVASGVYGEADISGFEIGNEYWGSGKMNAVEYGRLSSEMSAIIDDELDLVSEIYGIDTSGMSVLTQMGHNHGSSCLSEDYIGCSAEEIIAALADRYPDANITEDFIWPGGGVNWTGINNELIKMSFDTEEEINSLDGIISHVYTHGSEQSRYFDLDHIQKSWLADERFEDVEIHITEWNLKSGIHLGRNTDYGLYQAHDMLNTIEEFMGAGVDQAHVWPLIQNTANPLSVGFDYSGPTAPGEMFSMMSQHLPGKMIVDFTPGASRQSEFQTDAFDLHAFASPDEMLLYIASTSEQSELSDIDITGFLESYGDVEIKVLGVDPGSNPGSTRSPATVESRDASEILHDGILEADLEPGQIMQVVIKDIVPTDAFAPVLQSIADALLDSVVPDTADETTIVEDTDPVEDPHDTPDDEDIGIPVIPIQPEDLSDEPEESEDSDNDSGGWGEIAAAIAFLPLIGLLGMAV